MDNSNLKEEYLGLKQLYLNWIDNSIFAKSFLSYLVSTVILPQILNKYSKNFVTAMLIN